MGYEEGLIQPTMRRLVRWLRSLGLETTDSGDGVTNVLAGMEGALSEPHVFCVVNPDRGVVFSDALWGTCEAAGIKSAALRVEFTYNPQDGVGILAIYGVTDADLPESIL